MSHDIVQLAHLWCEFCHNLGKPAFLGTLRYTYGETPRNEVFDSMECPKHGKLYVGQPDIEDRHPESLKNYAIIVQLERNQEQLV